ncbi:hypothetical protein F5Y10DRAFT_247260 [Nemania abortiva]|nr:hypothetical protein F5Y10DRAFT_247260 [Nemania abortiva]
MSESLVDNTNPAALLLHGPASRPLTTEPVDEIKFHHPGYKDGSGILFSLPRLDRSLTPPDGVRNGVHYGTALTACQIVANNAFHGYLATNREGSERVDPDLSRDHLLTKSDYWFIVPADGHSGPNPPPYPVVPSFRDWAFPHRDMPNWPRPKNPPGVDIDDSRCIVTRVGGLVNNCHLIPVADEKWFKANHMAQWYGKHRDINEKTNKITLRHDLHFALDAYMFAVVPKANNYVVHQLFATDSFEKEFASAFHNHIVLQPSEVIPEFLFARFARAILMLVKAFITQGGVRRNIVRLQAVDDEDYTTKTEWLSPEQLANQYSGGGTKSASPPKRKRNNGTLADNQQEYIGDDDNTNYQTDNNDSDTDRESRGRSRKRRRGSLDDMDGEWYDKNVAVLLEEGRGRSLKRRCDDSGT